MALPSIPNAQSLIDNATSNLSLESSQARQALVLINGYPIDCSLSEGHEYESEVTEYPVESGSNVADNIRPKPITVTMECIVSNTPIGALDSANGTSKIARATGVVPAADAYKRLLDIRNARQLVTISTSLDTFTNMALQSLSIPRTSGGGDYLHFTAKFLQVTMVQNIRTVRTSTPIGTGKTTTTKAPAPYNPANFRLIDTKLGTWFDTSVIKDSGTSGTWRFAAIYDKKTGLWQLFRQHFYSVTLQQEFHFQARMKNDVISVSNYNIASPLDRLPVPPTLPLIGPG